MIQIPCALCATLCVLCAYSFFNRKGRKVQMRCIFSVETKIQGWRIKSSQNPERKLRCCRTGLCLFFAYFIRQPCK